MGHGLLGQAEPVRCGRGGEPEDEPQQQRERQQDGELPEDSADGGAPVRLGVGLERVLPHGDLAKERGRRR